MLYADKYPDMDAITDERDGIIRGFSSSPCYICGKPSQYIELNYEATFCSEECLAEMDLRSDIRRIFNGMA